MNRKLRGYTRRNLKQSFLEKFFSNLGVVGWLILINVLFFIVAMFLISVYGEQVFNYIALKPADILQGKYLWTLLTSVFMHGGFGHLLINMFVLFSLGHFCERIIGKKRFLWFYLISGILAGVITVLLTGFFGNSGLGETIFGSPAIPGVGASGAIFAIAGLLMILIPHLKFTIIFFPFFSLPAYVMIPIALFGMWILTAFTGLPIGNSAHFGGFLAGVVYGVYLRKKYPNKIRMLGKMVK